MTSNASTFASSKTLSPDADKETVALALIDALEFAEKSKELKDKRSVAKGGYDKLQFDFPVISVEELAALITVYTEDAGYPLSVKFLKVLRDGSSCSGPAGTQPGHNPNECSEGEDDPVTDYYQKLYAVILVTTMRRALGNWGAKECANALGQLAFSLESHIPESELQTSQENLFSVPEAQGDLTMQYTAQQVDDDDGPYEPLDTYKHMSKSSCGIPSQSTEQQNADFVWEQERHLIIVLKYLAKQIDWHYLNGNAVWYDIGLVKEILDCLQAVRRHKWFEILAEPVAEPLLLLLVHRMFVQPTDITCYASICTALGLVGQENPDPVACRLVLSTAAVLANQLTNKTAQKRMWQVLQITLLPIIAAQLDSAQTAYAKNLKQLQQQAGKTGVNNPQTIQKICSCTPCFELVNFYVLYANSTHSDSGLPTALLARGLFRAMVLLFSAWAEFPEADSLRCAMLLCCTASPVLLQWAVDVAGFTQAALGLHKGLANQMLAAHETLWIVILRKEELGDQLASLLQKLAADPDKVDTLAKLLHLMTSMRKVSQDRNLWDDRVQLELKSILSALQSKSRDKTRRREHEQGHSTTGGGSRYLVKCTKKQQKSSDSAEDHKKANMTQCAAEEEKGRRHRELDAQELLDQRCQLIYPVCMKLLKELLELSGASRKQD